ncbi:ATP-dependent hsl protease ATP-binding subunit hslU, putative [Perkinsus marinus ATCC 50983]|uniref:ATP-dependent hsl protease ATP-binding subunit hslU, putative n=1 Tax=Perkinsus marinus (strain ATCC 50983 / TXsc) TaxID=423536 RepID=C5LQR3_PERM5|nr:ATP-dependent hsl protease ATP-binding subunit hslU, putative [Perkinsus marinus ATCC 50983]EER00798.1 ATP-dependent hsl protease ATP-binding subunit hslU, putative [Perkinsus marinus ATCC 50983]|eukprot:XP_002768080.1 ATP-dependent hsl protease ATP-binding subunit hslU, putative [Perkinsus marinus ATCC 50983]
MPWGCQHERGDRIFWPLLSHFPLSEICENRFTRTKLRMDIPHILGRRVYRSFGFLSFLVEYDSFDSASSVRHDRKGTQDLQVAPSSGAAGRMWSSKDGYACPAPKDLVKHLDEFIIGQNDAKRVVAIAVRDRWRRQQIPDAGLRKELLPTNILLEGPSGSGKTEIARRLADVIGAPLVKVVATKYTEVGFIGEDTQTMIHELADSSYDMERKRVMSEVQVEARQLAIEAVARSYLCTPEGTGEDSVTAAKDLIEKEDPRTMDTEIEIESHLTHPAPIDPSRPGGIFDGGEGSRGRKDQASPSPVSGRDVADGRQLYKPGTNRLHNAEEALRWSKLAVRDAMSLVTEHYASILIIDREPEIRERARVTCEERGMVFIDEFDKLISEERETASGFGSKRRGVQKELLSLIEGTVVTTPRLGRISTEHILFICAGAFTTSKPAQIMPELQGRLPIRSVLKPLTTEDFYRILTGVRYALPMQQQALLKVEGVDIQFDVEALQEIAKSAFELNRSSANTGARRLQSVMSTLLEEIKFDAGSGGPTEVRIDKDKVKATVAALMTKSDLSKYVI